MQSINPFDQFDTETMTDENPFDRFDTGLDSGNSVPLTLVSPYKEKQKQETNQKNIHDIATASRNNNFVTPNIQPSNLVQQGDQVVEAPRSREADPVTKGIVQGFSEPVLNINNTLENAADEIKQCKLGQAGIDALTALIDVGKTPFTIPYSAVMGALKGTGDAGTQTVEGVENALNIPSRAIAQGSELTKNALNALGIDLPTFGDKEFDDKANQFLQDIFGTIALDKVQDRINALNKKQQPLSEGLTQEQTASQNNLPETTSLSDYFDLKSAPVIDNNPVTLVSPYKEELKYGAGNIDLTTLPVIKNNDGSVSTVPAKSFNIDGKEVLLPAVGGDGNLMSDQQIIDAYKNTGKNLGIFNTPEEADAYAQQLHNDQAKLYIKQPTYTSIEILQGNNLPDAAVGILPEVISTAQKGNDFPVFNKFRQKYNLPSNFGFDKLKDFYNIASNPIDPDPEGIKDYLAVVDELANKTGNRNALSLLDLPQRSILEPDYREQRLKDISNMLEKSVTGEGEGAFLNPFGAVIQGAKSGIDQIGEGIKQTDWGDLLKNLNENGYTGLADMTPQQTTGILNIASGAFKTGMSLYPELAAANMAGVYATPVAEYIGNQIGGDKGKEIAGKIAQIATIAPMGLPMTLGTIANIGGSELTDKILQGENLTDEQKGLLKEATGQLSFIAGAMLGGAGKGILDNIKNKPGETKLQNEPTGISNVQPEDAPPIEDAGQGNGQNLTSESLKTEEPESNQANTSKPVIEPSGVANISPEDIPPIEDVEQRAGQKLTSGDLKTKEAENNKANKIESLRIDLVELRDNYNNAQGINKTRAIESIQDKINELRPLGVNAEFNSGKITIDSKPLENLKKGYFGTIYNQFKGKAKEAVEFLLRKKEGEVPEALYHNDIGKIDLVWGKEGTGKSNGYGLAKIAKYHPEVLDDLQEILDDTKIKSRTNNRIILESDDHKAVVRLNWNNKEKTWLLSEYKKKAGGSTYVPGTAEGKTTPLPNETEGSIDVSGTTADRTTPLSNTKINNNNDIINKNVAYTKPNRINSNETNKTDQENLYEENNEPSLQNEGIYESAGKYHLENLKKELGEKADIYPTWHKRMVKDFRNTAGVNFRKIWRDIKNKPE